MTSRDLQKAKQDAWKMQMALLWIIGCAVFVMCVWAKWGWEVGGAAIGFALAATAVVDDSYKNN